MKLKAHGEIQGPMSFGKARTEDEIRKFFQAIDSYSSGVVKDTDVTFHQHLQSILVDDDARRLRNVRRP